MSGSSIYVQALNHKLWAWSNRKPAPSYVKGVLRRFVNSAIQAELLYFVRQSQKNSLSCLNGLDKLFIKKIWGMWEVEEKLCFNINEWMKKSVTNNFLPSFIQGLWIFWFFSFHFILFNLIGWLIDWIEKCERRNLSKVFI